VKVGVVAVDELPLAGAVIVTAGAVVSIRNVRGALVPTLPAWSACDACTVYVPSPMFAGAVANAPAESAAVSVSIGEPEADDPT